jgi:hypothetical protein
VAATPKQAGGQGRSQGGASRGQTPPNVSPPSRKHCSIPVYLLH